MRSFTYKFINILMLLVVFGVFKITITANLDKVLTAFSLICITFFINQKLFFNKSIFYSLVRTFLILFIPLLITSIFGSKMTFGQGILDSVIANFEILKLPLLIFYSFIFTNEKIDIIAIEKGIIYLICLEVVLQIIFKGHDKAALKAGEGFLNADKLPKNFMRFGVYYFFGFFIKKGKTVYALIAIFLLLFPNLISDFQRGYVTIAIFVLGTTFLFLRKKSSSVNIALIAVLLCFLSIGFVFLFGFSNPLFTKVQEKYSSLVAGIDKGKSSDPGINYRFFEVNVATKHMKKHPIIGAGRIRSTNVEKFIGKPYYPTDIGVIGVLGTYGVIGLTVYLYLFVLGIKSFLKALKKSKVLSPLSIGLVCYILHLTIESLQTGSIIFSPILFAFVLMLLRFSNEIDTSKLVSPIHPEILKLTRKQNWKEVEFKRS